LAGTVTVTIPLPVPLPGVAPNPEAVHGHPASEERTLTAIVPPAAASFTVDGLMAMVHTDPNCVIV
jgi:hypothetical protein